MFMTSTGALQGFIGVPISRGLVPEFDGEAFPGILGVVDAITIRSLPGWPGDSSPIFNLS